MAGIFDRMNHQGTGPGEVTLAPAFLCGILMMKVAGVRNNAQLLTETNNALAPGSPLDSEAEQDLLDVVGYIDAGTGESGKMARLDRFCAMAGIWETGLAGVTEAEARTMSGATFTS